MYLKSVQVYIYGDSVFSNNYAGNYGGAFYAYSLSLYINSSNITNNTAGDMDVGAFCGESAFLYLNDMTCVTDNYAETSISHKTIFKYISKWNINKNKT